MSKHEKLNYVEFPAKDIPATKRFFESVFNWSFTDFGEAYTTFENKGFDGGFSHQS
ncbi:MAG: putative enzyme related to lactoylglutathione lyase [Methylophilaceae bacterium]|jgi:predicted enzyme related to lactoylglutathione lyase